MKTSATIPWARLLAESGAIIGSILLAFAIDAWWEDRKEARYEQIALAGLQEEYKLHHTDISAQIGFHELLMFGIAQLMQACQAGSYLSETVPIDDAIYASLVPVTTDLGSSVRDSLISAGQIEIISDITLRNALSDWDRVVDEVVDGQLYSSDLVRDHLLPHYMRLGISLAHGERDKNGSPWPLPTQATPTDSPQVRNLFSDEAYCVTLEHRYGQMSHTLDEYGLLLESIEAILRLIEESLRASAPS